MLSDLEASSETKKVDPPKLLLTPAETKVVRFLLRGMQINTTLSHKDNVKVILNALLKLFVSISVIQTSYLKILAS